MDFANVDLVTPWVLYWLASLAFVVGGTLVVVGLWRARRHRRFAAAHGRNTDVGLLEDTRVQRGVGAVALTAAVGLGVTGAVLHVQGLDALRGNLEAKYGYPSVDRIRQSGPGFVADLTQADGRVLRDEMVLLESSGEPVVGEDIFARPAETR